MGAVFRRLLDAFLASHRSLAVEWMSADHVRFPKADDSGFDVDVYIEPDMLVVNALGAHEHFDRAGGFDDEGDAAGSALAFVEDLLGPAVRLREKRAGDRPYRYVLERRTDSGWEASATTAVLFFNYLARRTERIYQNRQL